MYLLTTIIIQLAETDLAAQARLTAAQLAQTAGQAATVATHTASGAFNRFVEGEEGGRSTRGGPAPDKADFWDSFGASAKGPEAEKKDFWDSFGGANEESNASIGTRSMKAKVSGGGQVKKDDDWGEW